MNRNSMYLKDPPSPDIFIAGLCLRKKKDKEIFSRLPLYNPEDYEVLLKNQSMAQASFHYWEITCTVLRGGRDPQMAIIQDMYTWTKSLGGNNRDTAAQPAGIRSKKAVFLSLHGGANQSKNSASTLKVSAPSVILCYLLPTTHKASSIVDSYPSEPQKYPTFKCLKTVLKGMRNRSFNVHPFTMEMLSSLDNWLREKHSIPDAINHLFTQALNQRLQKFCINPMYRSDKKVQVLSPSESFVSASHLFQGLSTSTSAFSAPISPIAENVDSTDNGEAKTIPVDIFVQNTHFGQKPRTMGKVNIFIVNENFGKGIPDYDAIKKLPKQVSSTVIAEPTGGFPLHQYAMNGNVEGVMTCANSGLSVNDKDDESWAPLHYACWCGHVDVAKSLVLELQADVSVKDNTGSTPLHIAAKNGHADVVSFLLTQPGIDPSDTDRKGRTPLQACLDHKKHNWQSVVPMLKEARPVPAVVSRPGSAATKAIRLRVEFMNGGHKILVLSQGQSTQSYSILKDIYEHIELPSHHSAVFSLWLKSDSVEIPLGNKDKPLAVLNSNWHQIVQHLSLSSIEVPVVCVRRNVHFSVDKEKLLTDPVTLKYLFSDAYQRVLKGYYPCSEDGAVYLAGIVLSITHGDYNKTMHSPEFVNDKLGQLIPSRMAHSKRKSEFVRRILEQYEGTSQEDITNHTSLHLKYLKYCWQWQFYGAMFFPGTIKPHSMLGRNVNIRLGINHLGFHIVIAEDNMLDRTLGLEGTDCNISSKNKEITLKQRGGECTTVIKSKYIQIIELVFKKVQEKKDEKSSQYNLSKFV